jgi:hypothetical protein
MTVSDPIHLTFTSNVLSIWNPILCIFASISGSFMTKDFKSKIVFAFSHMKRNVLCGWYEGEIQL